MSAAKAREARPAEMQTVSAAKAEEGTKRSPEALKPVGNHRVARMIGAVVLAVLLALSTLFTVTLFAVDAAVTSENVEALIQDGDLFATLMTKSADTNDQTTLDTLTAIASDPTVKANVGGYFGAVVTDIRTGSRTAHLDDDALYNAMKPYTLPLVNATFTNGIRNTSEVEDFFSGYAAHQVVFTLEQSMGDWQKLLAVSGVDEGGIASLQFALSPAARVLGVLVSAALGIALVAVLRRNKGRGFTVWGIIWLVLGLAAVGLSSGAAFGAAALSAYGALLNPLDVRLAVCGWTLAAVGVVLVIVGVAMRRSGSAKDKGESAA